MFYAHLKAQLSIHVIKITREHFAGSSFSFFLSIRHRLFPFCDITARGNYGCSEHRSYIFMFCVLVDKNACKEDMWADCEKSTSAYDKSKTIAEKSAWDFVKELPGMHVRIAQFLNILAVLQYGKGQRIECN